MTKNTKLDAQLPLTTRKLIKSLTDNTRTVEQQLDALDSQIRTQGLKYPPSKLRQSMIIGLDMRPREWGAPFGGPGENVIMLGCQPMLGIHEITAFCKLVQKLGGKYTFTTNEHCCAVAMIRVPLSHGDEAGHCRGLEASKEFIGKNIVEARKLGAKRMYYICPWCVYAAQRFYGDSDIEQRYYLDLALELVNKAQPRLRLEKKIAYYQGGQHLKPVYLGEKDWDCDWKSYRDMVGRVEGLTTLDIPKTTCCMLAHDPIFDAAREKQAQALVSPCWSCTGYLRTKMTDIAVKGVSEILLEAMGD